MVVQERKMLLRRALCEIRTQEHFNLILGLRKKTARLARFDHVTAGARPALAGAPRGDAIAQGVNTAPAPASCPPHSFFSHHHHVAYQNSARTALYAQTDRIDLYTCSNGLG